MHTAVGLTRDGRRYGHFDFSNNGEGFRKSLSEVMKETEFGERESSGETIVEIKGGFPTLHSETWLPLL